MTEQAPTTTSHPKPRIRFLGGTRYVVESRGQPGVGRQVDTLTLRCSCPAGQHQRRCWHLVAALTYEQWRKREEAKARAASRGTAAAAPAPVQATNWSSRSGSAPAPVAQHPGPAPAAAARPPETGMQALIAAFE